MLAAAYVVILTVIAAAIVAFAQYLFKKSVPKFKFNASGILSLITNRKVVVGVLIYMVGLVFYLTALGSGELSFVYPAFSSTFIFVILISHFALNEKTGYRRIFGVLLIILGITLAFGII